MAYYPTPGVNDTQDMLTVFQWISNSATDGLFFPIMILTIWIIQFIGTISEGRGASRGFLFASFTSTILAIILGILAMMAQKWVYLLVILTSLGVFWVKLANARE